MNRALLCNAMSPKFLWRPSWGCLLYRAALVHGQSFTTNQCCELPCVLMSTPVLTLPPVGCHGSLTAEKIRTEFERQGRPHTTILIRSLLYRTSGQPDLVRGLLRGELYAEGAQRCRFFLWSCFGVDLLLVFGLHNGRRAYTRHHAQGS